MKKKYFRAISAHAGLIFWLMAFPHDGILLGSFEGATGSFAFLFPHGICVLLSILIVNQAWFNKAVETCIFLVIFITLFFPYYPQWSPWLLALTGVFSSVFLLRIAVFHATTSNPVLSAVAGQIVGIFIFFIMPVLVFPQPALFILAAMPLLFLKGPPQFPAPQLNDKVRNERGNLLRALPIIFLLYATSGLTHGLLVPFYTQLAVLPGAEVFSYAVALIIGLRLSSFNLHIPLVLAIVLAIFAMGLWQTPVGAPADISMFAMHLSKGFADIFLFALMLRNSDVAYSYPLGSGVMLLGLSCGMSLSIVLGHLAWAFVLIGNLMVCATVLVFLLQRILPKSGHREQDNNVIHDLASADIVSDSTDTSEGQWDAEFDIDAVIQSTPFSEALSPQERKVLVCALQGENYKNIGVHLEITESSVKTYMARIFVKAGVKNKGELMKTFFKAPHHRLDHDPP